MKQLLRRLVIIGLLLISTLVMVTAFIAGFFEDQIGRRVVKELNKSLTTELQIETIDLSVIKAFPNASVNLRNVRLQDRQDEILLEAENLSFLFNLFSIFGSNIRVESVVAEKGALAIRYDQQGNANYDIFTSTETETSSSSDFAISLSTARLQDVELIYEDAANKQTAFLEVKDATFKGQLGSSVYDLESKASILARFVEYGEDRFLIGKNINYDAKVAMNVEAGSYEMERLLVQIEENEFDVDGTIEVGESYTDFDLVARNDGGNLEGVLQMLPERYLESFGDFKSRGKFYFNAFINGRMDQQQQPEIDVEFGLEDGRLSSPRLTNDFRDVSFDAKYNNGVTLRTRKSFFNLKRLKGYFNNELIELSLMADDLEDPMIDFSLNGALPLKSVYGLFGNENIKDGRGEIEIENLKVKGKYSDMQSVNRIANVEASGTVYFDDARLDINEERMIMDRGEMVLDGNTLTVREMKLEGAGSEIRLDGSVSNLLPVFFADSLNTKDAELEFEANLKAPVLDLDRLMALTTSPVEASEVTEEVYDSIQTAEVQQREQFTQFLNGTFTANIESFNYEKINGTDFNGQLEFYANQMTISGNTKAMDGVFNLIGTMYFQDKPYLKARLRCESIDGNRFFYECENFGQEILTDQHIKGDLDAKIAIYAYWDEQMNFDYDQLRVLAEMDITDGALNDFEMFKSFSTFVNIKDLERVKFADLTNWLEIRNSKIYIPVMFIQSNAINLTLNGEYTFDYAFDFNVKVNAGQVIANRVSRHDPNLKPLPSKRKGWFNLYYKIYGQSDDYKYESAKREVKRDFERSERRKNQIKSNLEQEFGTIVSITEPYEWLDEVE